MWYGYNNNATMYSIGIDCNIQLHTGLPLLATHLPGLQYTVQYVFDKYALLHRVDAAEKPLMGEV